MSATRRGLIIFVGIILVLTACSIFSFSVLPGAGTAVALPVIVVPAEPYQEGWPSENFNWTNTLTAVAIADVLLVLFVALVWRTSRGWSREVPTRLQSIAELLGGAVYGMCKSIAGKNARILFPLVASIFLFLLVVNWMKLIPGVESVGVMHCAGHSSPEIGISIRSGHPRLGNRLWVDQALFAGYDANDDDYHHCKDFKAGIIPNPTNEQINAAAATLREQETALNNRVNEGTLSAAARDEQVTLLRQETTEALYPHAPVELSPDALERGVIPYLHVVTPYVRGGSTDLNLTFGLALISFVAIQVFGVIAHGPGYFQKFVNLNALGNAGKRPMGLMDFGVGLFEIVTELGKVVSLSFRLFGNLFAGGVLLAVMSFLVAFVLPGVFLGLEIIITTIQALVFAVLTLVFSAQAMEGHHGDEDHGDAAHH